MKRACLLQQNLIDGKYEHNDVVAYALNSHAIKTHKKKLFKRHDMSDVLDRVKTLYPLAEYVPSLMIVDNLPSYCIEFMRKYSGSAWKVEWMFNGTYDYQSNGLYTSRYMKYGKCKERGIYSKLWDGMGFSKVDTGYKLWVESVYRPGQVVKYEGNAFVADTKTVICQVARMMTHIFDYSHIATITIIGL